MFSIWYPGQVSNLQPQQLDLQQHSNLDPECFLKRFKLWIRIQNDLRLFDATFKEFLCERPEMTLKVFVAQVHEDDLRLIAQDVRIFVLQLGS